MLDDFRLYVRAKIKRSLPRILLLQTAKTTEPNLKKFIDDDCSRPPYRQTAKSTVQPDSRQPTADSRQPTADSRQTIPALGAGCWVLGGAIC
jgi:hypothetical protein